MTQKKVQKRGNDKDAHVDQKDYIIIALATVSTILFACVIAVNMKLDENVEKSELFRETEIVENIKHDEITQLRYWSVILVTWHDLGHLRTMDRVFENLQYKFVNASHGEDWDFLWSIEDPFYNADDDDLHEFELFADFHKKILRKEQKVNHFPGTSPLVSKSRMNEINAHLKYILPSFILPYDLNRFDKFLKKNPNVKFVEKNKHNRGVKIMTRKEVLEERSNVFYQLFMDNHLLIDGHAFDFGVFVLITSVDPLRIYRYDADMLFRFCVKKYHPFDANDVDKYVVR